VQAQGRYRDLSEQALEELQREVDAGWARLAGRARSSAGEV